MVIRLSPIRNTLHRIVAHGGELPPLAGEQLLCIAGETGWAEIIPLLIDRGIPVNARSEEGRTALMEAAANGHLQSVKALLHHGADVHAMDFNGATALLHCIESPQLVSTLLDAGANPNHADSDGKTALFGCPMETALLLLNRGIAVDSQDRFGETPLTSAVSRRNGDVVHLLIQRGADVNHLQYGRFTPLNQAASYGDLAMMRIIARHGGRLKMRRSGAPIPFAWLERPSLRIRVLARLLNERARLC